MDSNLNSCKGGKICCISRLYFDYLSNDSLTRNICLLAKNWECVFYMYMLSSDFDIILGKLKQCIIT